MTKNQNACTSNASLFQSSFSYKMKCESFFQTIVLIFIFSSLSNTINCNNDNNHYDKKISCDKLYFLNLLHHSYFHSIYTSCKCLTCFTIKLLFLSLVDVSHLSFCSLCVMQPDTYFLSSFYILSIFLCRKCIHVFIHPIDFFIEIMKVFLYWTFLQDQHFCGQK